MIFNRNESDSWAPLLVPVDASCRDFVERMRDFVERLVEFERRPASCVAENAENAENTGSGGTDQNSGSGKIATDAIADSRRGVRGLGFIPLAGCFDLEEAGMLQPSVLGQCH